MVKLDKRLEKIFKELEDKAYDVDFHQYYYKETNQIIRKNFELLFCDGKSSVQSESNCNILHVSQQRELLLAFAKHQRDWGNTQLTKEMHKKEVNHFLKANNCG